MKKLLLAALCLAVAVAAAFADTLTADFESQRIPDGWEASGVTVKKDNNSYRAAMGTNATLTTPAIAGLRSVSYRHRGSGNNKQLIVEATADGGASWTQVGSTLVSSSSAYGQASHPITLPAGSEVRVRFTCKSATIFLDDIALDYLNLAQEPTVQASLAATGATGSTITASVLAGNGSGRLVAIAKGAEMTWTPEDGTSYGTMFPRRDGDVTILASGNPEAVEATGLEPGCRYTMAVFEYNGTGQHTNYLCTGGNTISVSTLTVPVISCSPAALDFHNTAITGSKELTLTLTGRYLDLSKGGEVRVTSADEAFSLSLDGETYSDAVTIPCTATETTMSLRVRFAPTELRAYGTALTVAGAGAEATVECKGRGALSDNREYYIAPDGDDNADGSMEHPWLNLQKAVNAAQPGDIIYCRGGRYHFTQRDSSGKLTVRIKTSGTPEAPITITAYGDEHPVFDFEQQLLDCGGDRGKVGDRGMLITGDWWRLYGLHITHAADNGIKLEGSHNRIERCEFSYNLDSGIQLGFGHDFSASGHGSKNDGSFCAYNDIIDCDSHHNCDFDMNYGSDADGFACKMHNGKGNRFVRCRAWRNSDDAWDLYETDFSVVLIECWAWESGKASDHEWVYEYFGRGPGFSGNGNGIKLGGNGSGGSSQGVHYAYNCIVFGNNKSGSTKGFDCNSHKGGHVVVGGLAFDNGYDFMFESGGGANSEFYNNVCFGRQEILVGTESHNALGITPNPGKTFSNGVITDFSRADYESLSEADALAPRGTDGSLPLKFGRLKAGSKLIDAGRVFDMPQAADFPFTLQPVYGLGRDIGPYEYNDGTPSSGIQMITTAEGEAATTLAIVSTGRGAEMAAKVTVAAPTDASIDIVGIDGRLLRTLALGRLEAGAVYTFPLPADMPRGIGIAVLRAGSETRAAKMAR